MRQLDFCQLKWVSEKSGKFKWQKTGFFPPCLPSQSHRKIKVIGITNIDIYAFAAQNPLKFETALKVEIAAAAAAVA